MRCTESISECVPVMPEWQGLTLVHAKRCHLRVIDPGPVFVYRHCGRNHISRVPMARVESFSNDGLERGVARISDLRKAGIAIAQPVMAEAV